MTPWWQSFLTHWDWDEFVVQFTAALTGAAVAAVVAFRVVAAQTKTREQDREREDEDRQRLEAERGRAEAIRIRGMRAEAIGSLLSALIPKADAGQAFLPDRTVDRELLRLLFDGTDDSYDVYRWTRWKLHLASDQARAEVQQLAQTYDLVRVVLVSWIRPEDEAGALADIRNQLARDGTATG